MRLEAKDVGFYYKPNEWLFRQFSFSLERGEVVGLRGPSGKGKTTFGRILSGYLKPVEGKVLVNEKPLPTTGYHPVQLVFQHPEKAVNSRWQMKKIISEGWQPDKEILDELGIEADWLNRWPNELSGGELQRFCVARALGPNTKFLIADEMTTMLDAITQALIWQTVLKRAKQREMGILVVSHDHYLLDQLCTRIVDLT